VNEQSWRLSTHGLSAEFERSHSEIPMFHGYGVNIFYSIIKNFPGAYENIIFVSIAVIDSGTFKGLLK